MTFECTFIVSTPYANSAFSQVPDEQRRNLIRPNHNYDVMLCLPFVTSRKIPLNKFLIFLQSGWDHMLGFVVQAHSTVSLLPRDLWEGIPASPGLGRLPPSPTADRSE